MGYREYFVKVKKRKINPIRKMDMDSLIEYCKANGIEVEEDDGYRYVSIHDLFRQLEAKDVFGFGKYYENYEEIQKCGKPLFKNEEVSEFFDDYNAYVVGKEAVLSAIEWQHQKILNYFKTIALPDEEYEKANPFDKRTRAERLEGEVTSKIHEWSKMFDVKPYHLDNEYGGNIVRSWLYEYTIFDLVRIYNDTNWNTECLIFYGY